MRRKEFQVDDRTACEELLAERDDGVLAFRGEDGWPKCTPLNFVYVNGAVYFHGSKKGEKMKGLAADPRAEFVVYEAHAFIPSYFSDPVLACPATVYFRSVRIRGTVETVDDPAEKAEALEALMRKIQPEGGHAPIDAADPRYRSSLAGVSVLRLRADEMVGKFKFGQNLSDERAEQLAERLVERGRPGDADTAERIKKSRPQR